MSDKKVKVHHFQATSTSKVKFNLPDYYNQLETLLRDGWEVQDKTVLQNDDMVAVTFILEKETAKSSKKEIQEQ